MKASYHNQIALPEQIEFDVIWTADNSINQGVVDLFVNNLARPKWYEDKKNLNPEKDTRMWMLNHRQFVAVNDPFRQNQMMRIYQCEACGCGVSESGVDLGHIIAWRNHLKAAGVQSLQEARAAYNNLNNLRLECRSCNASHDWE